MDISSTLEPNSDQLDAVELLGGPRVFVIEGVAKGSAEQPVDIHLVDFPRPWRPGKSMRRVLASCWGVDASVYVGRRVELFCDPDVRFGSEAVGGTRIARLSHIDKQRKIPLLVSRGKSATYTVEPLPDAVPLATRISKALDVFAGIGVSAAQLEARLDRACSAWTALDVAQMLIIFTSIQRGEVTRDEAFPPAGVDLATGEITGPEPHQFAPDDGELAGGGCAECGGQSDAPVHRP